MKKTLKLAFAISLIFLVSCNQSSKKTSVDVAETIYYGGDILTMEGETANYAEAVTISDGKITFVGSKEEAIKQAGKNHTMVDLKGKTMMPGFIDPHNHPMLGAIVLTAKFATPFEWQVPWGIEKPIRGHEAFIAKVKQYEAELKDLMSCC